MPIFPLNSESLYNWREVSGLMSKYDCVKAYIAGHYHKGGYACADGIHYITVCGLVEGEKYHMRACTFTAIQSASPESET